MTNLQNRRSQIVIDRAAQGRIVLAVSWPPALCLAITAGLLSLFCMQLHDEAIEAHVELHSIVPVFITSISFLLFAAVFVLFNALNFSHRVAGPLYRIQKTLDAFRTGDIHCRAILRNKDFLKEAADGINDFLDWLEEHPPDSTAFADRVKERAGEESSADAASQEEISETTS